MSRLDDIQFFYKGEAITLRHKPEAKQQVKDLFLELIGEDEIRPPEGPKRNGIEQGLRRTRNKLKAELRKKVNEL